MKVPVILTLLAAWTGPGEGAPSGVATDALTGALSMEITEPWKRMNLPIDGAIVEASTGDSLPTVRVHDDEGLVAEQRFSPGYAVDEPNGEGCGERRVATVTMAL